MYTFLYIFLYIYIYIYVYTCIHHIYDDKEQGEEALTRRHTRNTAEWDLLYEWVLHESHMNAFYTNETVHTQHCNTLQHTAPLTRKHTHNAAARWRREAAHGRVRGGSGSTYPPNHQCRFARWVAGTYSQKSPMHPQKNPTHRQKSPVCPQKSTRYPCCTQWDTL